MRNLFLLAAMLISMLTMAQTTDSLPFVYYTPDNVAVFPDGFFRNVEIDGEGRVYVGTLRDGLYQYVNSAWMLSPMVGSDARVHDLARGVNGDVYASYHRTGSIIQAIAGRVRNLNTGQLHQAGLANRPRADTNMLSRLVWGVAVGADDQLWTAHGTTITDVIFTPGGLGRFDGAVWHDVSEGMPDPRDGWDRDVVAVAAKGAEVWASVTRTCNSGTCENPSLKVYSASGALLRTYQNEAFLPFSDGSTARAIFHDDEDRTWVGFSGVGTGLAVLDGSSWTRLDASNTPFPSGATVNSHAITQDSAGNVWVGTSNGLLVYRGGQCEAPADSLAWTLYTTEQGLPSDFVTGVAVDSANGKWISTNDGVVYLPDPMVGDFRGKVFDLGLNLFSGADIKRPAEGKTVELVNTAGMVVAQTSVTTEQGCFSFDTGAIDPTAEYAVRITEDTLPLTYVSAPFKPAAGERMVIWFPARLRQQLDQQQQRLQDLKFEAMLFGGNVEITLPTVGYDTGLLDRWERIDTNHRATLEAMRRAGVALWRLENYYEEGQSMSAPAIAELLSFIEQSFSLVSTVRKMKGVQEDLGVGTIVEGALKDALKSLTKLSWKHFGRPMLEPHLTKLDQRIELDLGPVTLKKQVTHLLNLAEAKVFAEEDTNVVKNVLREVLVAESNALLTNAWYLPTTQQEINRMATRTQAFDFEGETRSGYASSNEVLSQTQTDNMSAAAAAESLLSGAATTSDISDAFANFSTVFAGFPPTVALAAPLYTISVALKTASWGATGFGVYRPFRTDLCG